MSAPENRVWVDRATEGDMVTALEGISAIFWAIEILNCERVADEIFEEQTIRNNVAALARAGHQLANQVKERA